MNPPVDLFNGVTPSSIALGYGMNVVNLLMCFADAALVGFSLGPMRYVSVESNGVVLAPESLTNGAGGGSVDQEEVNDFVVCCRNMYDFDPTVATEDCCKRKCNRILLLFSDC